MYLYLVLGFVLSHEIQHHSIPTIDVPHFQAQLLSVILIYLIFKNFFLKFSNVVRMFVQLYAHRLVFVRRLGMGVVHASP